MNINLKNAIDLLLLAIKEDLTISEAQTKLGLHESYLRKFRNPNSTGLNIQKLFDRQLITQNEYDYFFDLYDQYTSGNNTNESTSSITFYGDSELNEYQKLTDEQLELIGGITSKEEYQHTDHRLQGASHNTDIDEKFDERSYFVINRDESAKIIDYSYTIYVRDELPVSGKLSRSEMDQIYNSYPYLTMNNVSALFPTLTYQTFKRILRVFKITKDCLFSIHILEEHTPEEIAEFTLKAKSHASHKKIVENRGSFYEREYKKLAEENLDLRENREWIKNTIDEITKNINVNKYTLTYKKLKEDNALFIYLADMHIGADNTGALLNGPYNREIFFNRLKQILLEINNIKNTIGCVDKIYVVNTGDALDGRNGLTTRGNHTLQQNMSNKEQFQTYLDSMMFFIEEIYKIDIANKVEFVSVCESNHGGTEEESANLALSYIFKLKHPDLIFNLFNNNIEHIEYGCSSFIITHGKDNHSMFKNLPLYLDNKTDLFFVDYCKVKKINSPNINVVKADLHQYATSMGKNIRYSSVPSLYSAGKWINANFGYSQPAFVYQICNKQTGKLSETYVKLD
jgi:hypothetical protein